MRVVGKIKMYLKYLSYVLRHKWYVFLMCSALGVPWRGICHDLSRFSRAEWGPYANYFYGPKVKERRDKTGYYDPTATGNLVFELAWLHHAHHNDHHWQWWVHPAADGKVKVYPMSAGAIKEMVADWYGAGMAKSHLRPLSKPAASSGHANWATNPSTCQMWAGGRSNYKLIRRCAK